MQILSIRGENIASLAKPFEIRLDSAPLAAAGLFAITGETGAGKSSLLDAMCLALYGNCPRLSGEGTAETVTDIGGQELKSTDARMVLRRGVASGFAEVTFRAADGETYTAGWQARRARDRIDGRLQAVERSLLRRSDGQMLETQIGRVNERVVELTGLTYDEFRRTILLAQGDFAAFLEARTQDRAAILEKVTGTGIYRDISRRVFERTRAAEAALATLDARRGEHQVLAPEERDAVGAEIATLRRAQTAAVQELAGVMQDLARYTALEAAQANLARAKARVATAGAALASLAEDRRWLSDWDRAQSLRGEVRELDAATRAFEETKAERSRNAEALSAQQLRVSVARDRATAAETAHRDAETLFKALAPIWDEATALDNMIVSATEEHAQARTALAELTEIEADLQKKRDELDRTDATLARQIEIAQRAVDAVEGHETLLASRALIEERLAARIEQAGLAATSAAGAETTARAIAEDRTRRDTLDADLTEATARIDRSRAVQEALKAERETLTAAAPADRLDRLAQTQADLRALRNAADDLRRADAALEASRVRQAAAEQTRAEQLQALNDARARQATRLELINGLRQPAEAAQAAASREAEHLRQHLVDGSPCPVCGSTAHPLMQDGEIARLARDLHHRLAAAQTERDAAEAEATAAETRIETARETIAAETASLPELKARIEAAEAGYARARLPLHGGPLADDLPGDPRPSAEAFEALHARLQVWRTALETDRDRLETLGRQYRAAETAIEAAKAEITRAEAERREIDARIATREREIIRLDQARAAAEAEVASIDKRLGPVLAPAGIDPADFGVDGGPQLDRLSTRLAALAQDRARVEAMQKERATLAATRAQAQAELSGAAANRARAATVEANRRKALDEHRTARRALLDGEETHAHRTRHNEARIAAQKAFDVAATARADASRDEAALASKLAASEAAEAKAATRATAAREALSAGCTALGIDEAHLIALHAADPAEVDARRTALTAAETERTAAEGACKERADELAALQRDGLPDTPKDALDARRRALDAEAQTRSETLGGLSEKLKADAEAAEALAGLDAEIAAARETSETWAAVNAAIGSGKGDKFAQIAQAVTLALLVERANLHLEDLKPRYRLKVAATDLALHVIDRDMAGDARPTRSLSGGERFLVSLALALALSGMGTRGVLAGTLFIDEGFGSLDAESLDLAIDALERLQSQGRTIGVISHVQAMKDRIPVQLQVQKTGGGASEVALVVR
ncbi:MAG: AAA family ATPase [Maritimibacter sp.]|nr:AAA family ATPase [Maritimibacter sp.]